MVALVHRPRQGAHQRPRGQLRTRALQPHSQTRRSRLTFEEMVNRSPVYLARHAPAVEPSSLLDEAVLHLFRGAGRRNHETDGMEQGFRGVRSVGAGLLRRRGRSLPLRPTHSGRVAYRDDRARIEKCSNRRLPRGRSTESSTTAKWTTAKGGPTARFSLAWLNSIHHTPKTQGQILGPPGPALGKRRLDPPQVVLVA